MIDVRRFDQPHVDKAWN